MNPPSDPSLGRQRHALITGGAGFIGSHLADHLLGHHWRVTVVDDLSTGVRSNLAEHADLRFIRGDLATVLGTTLSRDRFDHIYHLAAAVGVRLVMDEPIRSIDTNVHQTHALLSYATTHGTRGDPAPTLVASSSEVYGKSTRVPFSEDDDVIYGPTTRLRWSYAQTKAIDEYLGLAFFQKHGLPVVISRFFNTTGPRQVGTYGMVLPNFVSAALGGRPLMVHGDGTQTRCFCDVRDVAPALPRLLEARGAHGRVFNLGSDRLISINELASRVVATLGSSSKIEHIPYSEAFAPSFEDLPARQPNLSRIREVIGFSPSIPIERTIRDLAAFQTDQSEVKTPFRAGGGAT